MKNDLICSKGDTALFGKSTKAITAQWRVPDNRPLADFAPTIILKPKDFPSVSGNTKTTRSRALQKNTMSTSWSILNCMMK